MVVRLARGAQLMCQPTPLLSDAPIISELPPPSSPPCSPGVLWQQRLQVSLRLLHRLATAEAPALRQSMDVGVDRERVHPKRLSHDHRRCLVADSRQGLQLLKAGGDGAAVALQQQLSGRG